MTAKGPIYLDHHATTPVDPRVVEAMHPFFGEDYGNAASRTHAFGWRAEAAVEDARERLAAALGAPEAAGLVFTSGATESNNLALQGIAARARGTPHVVTAATEHPAVLDPCRALARRGVEVTVLPVDAAGLVDPAAVADAITERTALVSVMAANNETGVLGPLAEIGAVCSERGVPFHTDAAQAFGKEPLDVEALGVDLVSISGHKLYGPKGVGALWVRSRKGGRRIRLAPLLHGGGHERGLRAGTVPVPLVVGLARAAELALAEREEESERLQGLRDALLRRLREEVGGVEVNGHPTRRLPGSLNVSIEDAPADALLAAVGAGLAISTGSACSSATPEPSPVLRALGLSEARIRTAIRIGLGRFTTAEEVDRAAERLSAEVRRLRAEGAVAAAATAR